MDPNAKPPKVFISYSWTTEEYQQSIVDLAERLAGDGVHVILDAWDLVAGQDKFVFMEAMVTNPDVKHVLLMCDPRYAEKADSREGGVGTETQIVSKEVYAKTDQRKFIPVIMKRKEDGEAPLPAYISSRMYMDLSDAGKFAAEYERLLRLIFDKPARKRPKVGRPPEFLSATDALSPSTHLLRQFAIPVGNLAGRASFAPSRLVQSLLSDLRAQRLLSEPDGAIDDIIISKIQELKGLRDVTLEWFRQLLGTASDQEISSELVAFFEQLISTADWPQELDLWSDWRSDHLSFFSREVWLYAIAILIEARRWEAAKGLLGTTLCATTHRQFGPVGYGKLECYLKSLEEVANSKKESRRISFQAELVLARADDPQITFALLMQADFLLCLRGIIGDGDIRASEWYPRTLVYATRVPQPFPLFVRWRAGQLTAGIPALFGVPSRIGIYDGLTRVGEKALKWYRFDHTTLDFVALADLGDIAQSDRPR